ncbi:aminodeoxychorismate synthase component I [Lewinella sp. JB7]|uniref:aminodeoxychorismate synthase component I n=1 Tax=Lewinella sp. JB7 TaxID=2962887 RepID=UPI0020CA2546|nr:aminodeoxychorismate synthase component I [Lewinella sp. JB7]
MNVPTLPAAWIARLNTFGASGTPCFFLIDFELQKPLLLSPEEFGPSGIRFSFPERPDVRNKAPVPIAMHPTPVPFDRFDRAFRTVQAGLQRGDSFLTNLTFATPVELSASLEDVYQQSHAKYRVYLPGEFVSFSPETFVTIDPSGYLESRPMKGTAENTPTGRSYLLSSEKEIAEHATIVDLIRNDLSRVARRVRVTDYRYLESIETATGGLVQTSSAIGGQLRPDWRENLGTVVGTLLPAGSVSGAPKSATLALIRQAEGRDRGYYCGIAGYFDGRRLDTCVLIRYIERVGDRYFFRSGGGITARSRAEEEYRELNDKIRIPRSGVLPEYLPILAR